MLDFSVVGLGSIGWAVINGLHSYGFSYSGYDIVGRHDWSNIIGSEVVFICTPTPMGQNGRLNCNSVSKILDKLSNDKYEGIVVVKSTVSVGFMDKASKKYPELRMVYMPEFLRERSSYSWFLNPDRIVISGNKDDTNEVLKLFDWVPDEKIIHTDYLSAEIGKLAHNSYIATKVSFTNEMERICKTQGSDPHDVMEIVWRDRRVDCKAHLTPGLGPYGGKCVVKDMGELLKVGDSEFLKSVRQVNNATDSPETKPNYPNTAVIIPSAHGIDYLKRSLDSIVYQTYEPKIVVVVSDKGNVHNNEIDDLVDSFKNRINIYHTVNQRSQNLSGAINTGIDYLENNKYLSDELFIALLDDDDWWEHRYLENCIKFSYEYDSEWVVPGLIRYDDEHPKGIKQTIPHNIDASDFLVGNPNVQGSNLFILAKRLKEIGGFDEGLVSTTDRDVGIRLLQAGTKYDILYNHLVHHDALSRTGRLSHPGSEKKRLGLNYFYQKYSGIMSEEERDMFKNRAKKLFQIEINDEGGK